MSRASSPPVSDAGVDTRSAPPGLVAPLPGRDPDGYLVDGWEPHRPLSDGLLRRFVYAFASSFAGPVHHLGGRVVQRDAYVVWDRSRPAGLYNGAILLRPLPYDGWAEVIASLERDLLETGTGSVVLFSPFPSPDLTYRGWQLMGHPPVLLRSRGEPEPPVPPWLEVREVRDATTLEDWERVAVEGYPLDDLRPVVPGSLLDAKVLGDPAFHAWVGYVGGEPVTIGTSYVAHGVNIFALGATIPEARGRGAWRVMARRRLASFPGLPAMSLFSDDSRGPAELLGFRSLGRWTAWSRERPSSRT